VRIFLLAAFVPLLLAAQQERPDWLSGAHPSYPKNLYLTGIGEGATQEKAADKARATYQVALAKAKIDLDETVRLRAEEQERRSQDAKTFAVAQEKGRREHAQALDGMRQEVAEARRAVGEAVESTHRQYRRDLVPLHQELTIFGRIDLPER